MQTYFGERREFKNRLTSLWCYPMFFKQTSYPSCCVGHIWKGFWPACVRDLLWVPGRGGAKEGLSSRWQTLWSVQKVSYMFFLQITIRTVKEGEKRCFQREGLAMVSPVQKADPQSWTEHGCALAGRRAELTAADQAESTCSAGKAERKKERLVRTFKTLYARISVVHVAQASRRSEGTAHGLSRRMKVVSLQMKTLLRSAAYSRSVTHLLYFFLHFFSLFVRKRELLIS